MSWRAIARKDVRDAARSRAIWLIVGAFLLAFLAPALALPSVVAPDADGFVGFTQVVVTVFVPLVSIALGYKSVVGERDSGSIKLLLSFPHTRRDLAVGKFVGRSVVFAVPLFVVMVAAGTVVAVLVGGLPALRYGALVLATLAFGLAFLGLTLGLSMVTTSNRRVTFGAIGAYVLFGMLWDGLIQTLVLGLFRFMDPSILLGNLPDWALFVRFLGPVEAYDRLVEALFDVGAATGYAGPDAPWYVAAWVAPLVLVAWMVVPVAIGYRRFDRSDL